MLNTETRRRLTSHEHRLPHKVPAAGWSYLLDHNPPVIQTHFDLRQIDKKRAVNPATFLVNLC
jgi:hypothetical protein